MELGVKLNSFDYCECSLRTNSGIEQVFQLCYEEFLSVLSKKKKKREPTVLSQKLTKQEVEEFKPTTFVPEKRRSGTFDFFSLSGESKKNVSQLLQEDNMNHFSKIEFDMEKLYALVNYLQRENQERKLEIEELKKKLSEK
jgi:hypothetical protein